MAAQLCGLTRRRCRRRRRRRASVLIFVSPTPRRHCRTQWQVNFMGSPHLPGACLPPTSTSAHPPTAPTGAAAAGVPRALSLGEAYAVLGLGESATYELVLSTKNRLLEKSQDNFERRMEVGGVGRWWCCLWLGAQDRHCTCKALPALQLYSCLPTLSSHPSLLCSPASLPLQTGLSVTRAKVRTYATSKSSGHTFYVMDARGGPPDK